MYTQGLFKRTECVNFMQNCYHCQISTAAVQWFLKDCVSQISPSSLLQVGLVEYVILMFLADCAKYANRF